MARIFIYLFTAMLRDVTITSLLCLCIICFKTDVRTAGWLIREREHFCRNVMVLVGVSRMGKTNMTFIDPGTKVNSSYHFYSFWDRVCCLISKQDVANTNGDFNRMVGRHTQYIIPQIICKKRRLISSSLTWPQTSPILILLTMLLGGPFRKEATTDENLTQWKNWSEQ